MPDLRISELPAAGSFAETDLSPIVQSAGGSALETRRATLAQLRGGLLADRGAHVRDYGAKGDGSTNDAPAIQAAVNDLAARGGGLLFFGPRTYRLASAVTVSGTQVIFQGAGFTEAGSPGQGTWLAIDSPAFTPFTFSGLTARGSAVRDIAVFQAHSTNFAPGLGTHCISLCLPCGGLLRRRRFRQPAALGRQSRDLCPQLRAARYPAAARPGLRQRRRDRRMPRRAAAAQHPFLDLLDRRRRGGALGAGQWRRHDLPPLRPASSSTRPSRSATAAWCGSAARPPARRPNAAA